MSYFSRACVAASVAVARDPTDHGAKSLIRTPAKSFLAGFGLLPAAGFGLNRVLSGEAGESNRVMHGDDSVRQAMYISCWGPS